MFVKLTVVPDSFQVFPNTPNVLYGVMIDQVLINPIDKGSNNYREGGAECEYSVINILIDGRIFGIWAGHLKLSQEKIVDRLISPERTHALYIADGEMNRVAHGAYRRQALWDIELV